VVVLDGQEIDFARFEPPARSASLTPWTMSIATRVVGDLCLGAPLATQHVPFARKLNPKLDSRGQSLQTGSADLGCSRPATADTELYVSVWSENLMLGFESTDRS
jgi:hypothetical protein